MANGDRLNFIKNVFLPASIRTAKSDHSQICQPFKTKSLKSTTIAPIEEATVVEEDDWSPIWEFLPNVEKNPKTKDFYHVITVMLCIGLGFLIFMIVTIRVLYKMFKFKSGSESPKRSKRATRKPRRTSSITSRRLSRASSIISARST